MCVYDCVCICTYGDCTHNEYFVSTYVNIRKSAPKTFLDNVTSKRNDVTGNCLFVINTLLMLTVNMIGID